MSNSLAHSEVKTKQSSQQIKTLEQFLFFSLNLKVQKTFHITLKKRKAFLFPVCSCPLQTHYSHSAEAKWESAEDRFWIWIIKSPILFKISVAVNKISQKVFEHFCLPPQTVRLPTELSECCDFPRVLYYVAKKAKSLPITSPRWLSPWKTSLW